VWDESWVRDATLAEQQTSTLPPGGRLSSIAEEWERQRQLDRTLDNANSLWCHLYCDHCRRSGKMLSEFQTVNMSIGFGFPLIGMIAVSFMDLLLYFSMMLTSPYQTTRVPTGL